MDSLLIKVFSSDKAYAQKRIKIHNHSRGQMMRSVLRALVLIWIVSKVAAVRLPESAMMKQNGHSATVLKDPENQISITPLGDGDIFLDFEPQLSEGDQKDKFSAKKMKSSLHGDWKKISVSNGMEEGRSYITTTEVKRTRSRRSKKEVKLTPGQQQKLIENSEAASRSRADLAELHGKDGSSSVDVDLSEKNLSSSLDEAVSRNILIENVLETSPKASEITNSDESPILIAKAENPPALERTEEPVQEKDAPSQDADTELVPRYSLGKPIKDWDTKRQQWLERHPQFNRYTESGRPRMFILTGSQPSACLNAKGDHLLLRCFKNKVDYSRIHGIEIFYNTALLQPDMPTFWAKLPLVRATMLTHPEAEWLWWVDADAIVTDMEFEVPLERYEGRNFVVFGWESLVYEKRSWVGLNAGSFLIRNCEWSMEFMERWASMGPQGPLGEASGEILSDFLPDRPRNPTDDQAALVYILIKEREVWGEKVVIELSYFLHGYWVELVDGYESIEHTYDMLQRQHTQLSSRNLERQETLALTYSHLIEPYLHNLTIHQRRPFITHFTGCQPCSGHHNKIYDKRKCLLGMERALNYGDDQVLRSYGFQHRTLEVDDVVTID